MAATIVKRRGSNEERKGEDSYRGSSRRQTHRAFVGESKPSFRPRANLFTLKFRQRSKHEIHRRRKWNLFLLVGIVRLWDGRIRTSDQRTKTSCLTAWLRLISLFNTNIGLGCTSHLFILKWVFRVILIKKYSCDQPST